MPSLSVCFSSSKFSVAFSNEVSTGINEDSNSELANFSAFESSDEVLFLKFSSSALARSESSLAASNWDNTSSYERVFNSLSSLF